MNTKLIAIASVLVLAAGALYVYGPKPSVPNAPSGPAVPTTTDDVAVVMNEQYSAVMQEQLDSLSAEQVDFNSQAQDQMASDLSQFLYT
jgi:hypothetical protein